MASGLDDITPLGKDAHEKLMARAGEPLKYTARFDHVYREVTFPMSAIESVERTDDGITLIVSAPDVVEWLTAAMKATEED